MKGEEASGTSHENQPCGIKIGTENSNIKLDKDYVSGNRDKTE
jgi:hypothetical protein